jgi:hypothetical protein
MGVLTGLNETRVTTSRGATSLLDHIDFISGISGGSILAAYYGLNGRQTLSDFRERFLLVNPEEHLQTDRSPCSTSRADWRAVLTILPSSPVGSTLISSTMRRSGNL